MVEAILFIDGNNLYHNLKVIGIKPSLIDFAKLCKLICSFFGCRWKETVYYNSLPRIDDGKSLYYSHMSFLEKIKSLPKFTVKTRKLQKSSTAEIRKEKTEILKALNFCAKCKSLAESNCLECIGNIKKREKGRYVNRHRYDKFKYNKKRM